LLHVLTTGFDGSPGEFADLEKMTAAQLADFIRRQAADEVEESSLH
jgi:hypothetical protein